MDDIQKALRDADRAWKRARRTRERARWDAAKRVQRMYLDEIEKKYSYLAPTVLPSDDGQSILFISPSGMDEVCVARLEASGPGWVAYLHDVLSE